MESNALVMMQIQGTVIMGRLDGNKLLKPERYVMFNDPKAGPTQGLQHLPGNPEFIVFKDFGFYYPVKDKGMEGIYIQATTGIMMPGVNPIGPDQKVN